MGQESAKAEGCAVRWATSIPIPRAMLVLTLTKICGVEVRRQECVFSEPGYITGSRSEVRYVDFVGST